MVMLSILQFLFLSALAGTTVALPQSWQPWESANPPYKYAVVLSIDGLHSSDVGKYVALRPLSNMAQLLSTGIEYQNAWTSAV